jgi:hypothetical protein
VKLAPSRRRKIEAARGEVALEALEVVGPELVDGDDDHQLGASRPRLGVGRDRPKPGDRDQEAKQRPEESHSPRRRTNSARARAMVSRVLACSARLFHSRWPSAPARSRSIQDMKYSASLRERMGLPPTVT